MQGSLDGCSTTHGASLVWGHLHFGTVDVVQICQPGML
jgi:hypothetical protein